ncbi:HK97-gp10 family putative phage morphogenesis protein [Rhodovulum sulfidophilum]|uniref:HK97 gp10 family phage protein n=1 Tax=Rhodovulum sulfidophilum TaxID=35806 RepID=A0ABS1RZ04_RHOSU|nr:HK97-gp10 family putative phage morphogenesis protein [Rhodovulum sulfidophilum]MBL3611325.1 HK97 gp10 family phage protein [Rhodovulum sulfidophilum]
MSVTMKLEGFAELEAELDRLSQAAGKGALRRALRTAAEPLAERMRANAPTDEHELQESIAVSTKLSPRQRKTHRKLVRDDKASVEMFVGAGPLPQAHLQEFGTVSTPPQPWARPAWEAEKGPLLDRLREEMKAEIDKSVRRAEARAARAAARG